MTDVTVPAESFKWSLVAAGAPGVVLYTFAGNFKGLPVKASRNISSGTEELLDGLSNERHWNL
jgi:hypothetical protein